MGRIARRGYAVVELMVTIVIVALLAASLGVFLVKLTSIRERDREEAYIREKLCDICAAYADAMSLGYSFGTAIGGTNGLMAVSYRQETGGVSMETGVVTHVTRLTSALNPTNSVVDLNFYGIEAGALSSKLRRRASGDALLIPQIGDMVSLTVAPLNYASEEPSTNGFFTTDAALGYLQATARYEVDDDEGRTEMKTVTVGRVVRLWNRE